MLTLLRDPEWYEWSDRAIARHVTCSHTTVAKLRRQVDEERAAATKPAPAQPGLFDAPAELVTERDPEEPRVRRGADGRKINTSKIGAGKKQEQEEQRLRELLAGARELGAQDAAKGLRSQGEMVRALGGCPAGKLEVLWAAYRAALEEARAKAPAKTFQPASEATEALRGKPIGGPPLVPSSASSEVEKEDPAEEDEAAEEEDEEALCRICGKEFCEDADACLAAAAAEDGEDLDEDDGAEEAPRATALSVLGGLVRNLTSDPARKDEVGAELLRLAAELGAQPEGLPAYELRQALAGRNAAERERERSEERERALHRRLFDLAAAWRRQGQDGPRADLVAMLDGGAEDVAAVLGRSEARRALPWKTLARALRKRWQVSERNDAAACAELQEARKEIATLKAGAKPAKPGKDAEAEVTRWAELHRKASAERDEARRAVALLREDAGTAGLVVCEHDDGEGGCDRICAPNPEGEALCPAHQAAQAEAAAAPILKPKGKRAKRAKPTAAAVPWHQDPAQVDAALLEVMRVLREERGWLKIAEGEGLSDPDLCGRLADAIGARLYLRQDIDEGRPRAELLSGLSNRVGGRYFADGLRINFGDDTDDGLGKEQIVLTLEGQPLVDAVRRVLKIPLADLSPTVRFLNLDFESPAAAEEKRCEKCGCTNEKACEGGCFWVSPTLCSTCAPPKEVVAKVQEISAAQRARHARALEIAVERARMDAAGALPQQRARQSLLHVVAKQYGSMDAALCKRVWQAYQEAWERAKAAPAAPAPAAPTWQPASVGGAQAVHALPLGAAADGDHGRHPAALCKQRPNYKSKAGWTLRPGVALTCKGCMKATGSAP